MQLLTLPEVADRLRVSRRTVERLIDAGRIRPVRIGRRVLVLADDVAAVEATEIPEPEPEDRRPMGTGCVSYVKSKGEWWALISLPGGRKVTRSRKTRERAEQALDELLREYADRLGPRYRNPYPRDPGETRPRPRAGVTTRVRWLVLERDGFTCRYCGRSAPDVPRLQRVEPKSAAGWRTVSLPVPIEWPNPDPPNIDGLVFTSPTGAPRDPRAVSREWEKARKRLKIADDVTIHSLRHSAVSFALAGGASLDDVKRMVGHSNIAMTSDLYGHMVEGRGREVAGSINRAIRRKR